MDSWSFQVSLSLCEFIILIQVSLSLPMSSLSFFQVLPSLHVDSLSFQVSLTVPMRSLSLSMCYPSFLWVHYLFRHHIAFLWVLYLVQMLPNLPVGSLPVQVSPVFLWVHYSCVLLSLLVGLLYFFQVSFNLPMSVGVTKTFCGFVTFISISTILRIIIYLRCQPL